MVAHPVALNFDRFATLEEAWADFRQTVVGPFQTAGEVAQAKDTFYAGATVMLGLLLRYAGEGELEARLVQLCEEFGFSGEMGRDQ